MTPASYLEEPYRTDERDSTRIPDVYFAERDQKPEPPANYDPNSSQVQYNDSSGGPNHDDGSQADFYSVCRNITISKVLSLVSLVIGGVFLSTAAFVVAFMSYRRAISYGAASANQEPWLALKRSASIAIALAVIALVLNIVTLVVFYPMLVDMLQSGDYGSLFGSSQGSSNVAGTGTSTWG